MHVFIKHELVLLLHCVSLSVEAALLAVNNAIDGAVAEEILMALQSEVLDLKDVLPEIADYYCDGLVKRKSEKQDVSQAFIVCINL